MTELSETALFMLGALVGKWQGQANTAIGLEQQVYRKCEQDLVKVVESLIDGPFLLPNPAGETSGGPEHSSYPPLLLRPGGPTREAPLGGPVSGASERGAELPEEPGTLDETPTKRGGE